MQNRYYGDTDWVNYIASKIVFWALSYRRNRLIHRYRHYSPVTAKSDQQHLRRELDNYLAKGIDRINVGGGNKNLKGYLNLDFVRHDNVENELVLDVLDLSFIPDASISHVHSCHFIEHLSREQLREQFRAYYRILRKGGRVSLRCPNALGVCYGFFFGQYPESNYDEFLALGYPEDEIFYDPRDGWYVKDLYGLYHWLWAFTGNKLNQHLTQLTPTELEKLIVDSGLIVCCTNAPEATNLIVVAEKP